MVTESQRLAKKLYKVRNREKVNAQRRKRYYERRIAALDAKKCFRCKAPLGNSKRDIKYCGVCRTTYAKYLRYFWPSRKNRELQHSNIPLNSIQTSILERKKELWAIACDD